MEFRIKKDTMGEVKVPADKYWGAQTERSRNNFKIGAEGSMPLEVIRGFAYLKKAAAFANCDLGVLPETKRDLIAQVCDEILEGRHDDQFPLVIWQTGSGTASTGSMSPRSICNPMPRRPIPRPCVRWSMIWPMPISRHWTI